MKQPRLFLSYAREDTAAAARLCADLRARGRQVWYDRDCLRGGERWRDIIDIAIQDSDFFIALLSEASVTKRGTVQAEVKKALEVLNAIPDDQVYLIPVRLTECRPTNSRLKELHWIDLFPRWEEGVAQIMRSTDPDTGVPDLSGAPTPLDNLPGVTRSVPPPTEAPASVCVSEAIRETIDLFRSYAVLRNVGIRFEDQAPKVTVRAVRQHLINAVANVLSNAIKYTFASSGRPSWVDVSSVETGDAVQIRIQNWGLGIPPNERENIFLRGFRGKSAIWHAPAGLGIGLAVAKTVCDEYQGSIELESRPVRSHMDAGGREPHITTIAISLPRERNREGT